MLESRESLLICTDGSQMNKKKVKEKTQQLISRLIFIISNRLGAHKREAKAEPMGELCDLVIRKSITPRWCLWQRESVIRGRDDGATSGVCR